MYQASLPAPLLPPPTTATRTVSGLLGLTAVSAGLIGLAVTNPGPAAFQRRMSLLAPAPALKLETAHRLWSPQ